ncbi:hypothetical protein [Candidatus Tisiphia endosymbiont of Metellina segmentata]|uniref:hypothetical protein n=1 Tax=Candidatus Tisiphia endosymbiont of Metellina segmentata TaxID=3066274 RepID=UPI00313EEF89
MGRIDYSNGNRVNHVRKIGGNFLRKQDAKSHSLSNKQNNGNNIQKKTTAKIDDLPNIPAMLDYALNLPKQNIIDPIDGGTAHTPITRVLLPFLTLFSTAFPNTTAPPNKAIDNSNSSLSRVTSPTKVNTPVPFYTTPATTSTSQNHAPSKKLTKDPSLIREKDGLIRHDADGNIILNGKKLTFSYNLNRNMLKKQLENSNITELCIWEVAIDPQEVQEIGEILKDSNVEELSIIHSGIKGIDFRMLKDTRVTKLNLAYNGIVNKSARDLIKSLEGTNVEELNLSDNRIGNTGKGAKGLLTLLKKTKVKVLDLSRNNMSDNKVNDIIPELKENTKIIALGLKDTGIEHNTLKEVSKVLKQNRHVNKKSYIKSSPTEEESTESSATKEKSPNTSNKREKRDVHTTDETPQQETTVLTTDVSSTTATESTTVKATTTTESTAASTSTTAKKETTTPTTVSTTTTESTTPTTVSTTTTEPTTPTTVSTTTTEPTTPTTVSTTTTESTTPTTVSTTTTESTTPTTVSTTTTEPTTPTTVSTTTTEPTTPTTVSTTTTEPTTPTTVSTTTTESTTPTTVSTTTTEPTTPTTVSTTTTESTVPTTDGSSTTTTKSTASSAGNPTTDSATVWSNPQKTTTPKKNLTEKPEPIAADVVVDSITEKHTPKESNPNDPASSTMSTKEILALISFVLTAVSIGGGVAICVVKKFFDGASRLGHNALALADLAESDNHLDNNEETSSLTGVTVNDDMD